MADSEPALSAYLLCTSMSCTDLLTCYVAAGTRGVGVGMDLQERIESYARLTRFPRSLFVSEDGRIVGTWIMGNDYRVRSGYYGGYPAGYLRRVAALFPDRRRVLHVFSGRVDLTAMPGDTVDSNPDMNPTWVADAHDLSAVPLDQYDLVLADPPYSVEDAERYQTTMVQRNVVMRSLAAGMTEGARVVWLDQVLPMYRKAEWAIDAVIGMVKSTNHRFRVVTVFRRLSSQKAVYRSAERSEQMELEIAGALAHVAD
jgi:hypothetical protein